MGAVSSEPVSPRFSPRTAWANKSRIRDGSRPVPEYPASNSHDGRAPRVVMGTRRDPAPFLGVRGVCAHVRAHVASASPSASRDVMIGFPIPLGIRPLGHRAR